MSSTTNSQFIRTRNMFREYLSGYPKEPTFEEWNNAEEDDKAALLFVTFYKEITLAWYNAITANGIVCVTQEDGISTVLQYLMKNVPKISDDPKRYTQQYVYHVAFMSFFGIWRSRGTDMQRSSCEISNEYMDGDVAVNLWDLVPSEDEDLETQQTKEAIWNIIRHMGPKAEKVVNHLINPTDTLHKVSEKSSERASDRLADVSVTKAEYEEILSELKVKLAPYLDVIMTF